MAVQTIKLTVKRQATLPAALCRDLNLRPGDQIALERCEVDGSPAWIMRPVRPAEATPWFGTLHSFASGKSHAMEDVRRSIGSKAAEAKP